MCREEVKKILAIITSVYPNFKPDNMSMTVDAWSAFLKDDSFADIQNAVFVYGRTDASGFAPSVGQVLETSRRLKNGYEETEGEVWSRVYEAIINSNYHAKEEYERLPERIQKAIGSFEVLKSWGSIDFKELEVVKSNFLKAYRMQTEKEKDLCKLPQRYREMLEQTTQKLIGEVK